MDVSVATAASDAKRLATGVFVGLWPSRVGLRIRSCVAAAIILPTNSSNGLNVARDARAACADLRFAVARYALAREAVGVRQGIADLAEERLAAGDIGELEAIPTRS